MQNCIAHKQKNYNLDNIQKVIYEVVSIFPTLIFSYDIMISKQKLVKKLQHRKVVHKR